MRVTPQQLIAEQVQPDTFLAGFDLRLRQTFYPLGFPLLLETNSPEVLEAAEEGWCEFSQTFDLPPMRLCLGVLDTDEPVLTLKSVFSAREHLATLFADAGNFIVCDFRDNFTFGWVTRGLAKDHSLLRYRFLIPGAHMMAEQMALAPLHAALIVKDGTGVMLCGDSMAGKSTLAYACARAGWNYVTDDGTFLVRGESDRYAVGDFTNLRLREDAVHLFPARQPARGGAAKWKNRARDSDARAAHLQAARSFGGSCRVSRSSGLHGRHAPTLFAGTRHRRVEGLCCVRHQRRAQCADAVPSPVVERGHVEHEVLAARGRHRAAGAIGIHGLLK